MVLAGCAAHPMIPAAPPRRSERTVRLATYAAWRPTLINTTTYLQNGAVTQRTTDRLTLANDTVVTDPEDLIPLTGESSAFAEQARGASRLYTRFQALLGTGVGLALFGGGVMITSALHDGPVFGDATLTGVVGLGAIATGLGLGLVGGIAYSEPSRVARRDAFTAFDAALRANLGLCGDALAECTEPGAPPTTGATTPPSTGSPPHLTIIVAAQDIGLDEGEGAPPAVLPRTATATTDDIAPLTERLSRQALCQSPLDPNTMQAQRLTLQVQPDAPLRRVVQAQMSAARACHRAVRLVGRVRDRVVAVDVPIGNEPDLADVIVDLGARGYVVTVGGRFVQPGCHAFGGPALTIPARPDGALDVEGLRACASAMRRDEGLRGWFETHVVAGVRAAPERVCRDALAAAHALTAPDTDGRSAFLEVALGPAAGAAGEVAARDVPPSGEPGSPLSPPGVDDPARVALRDALQRASQCATTATTARVDGRLDPTTGRVAHAPLEGVTAEFAACVDDALGAVRLPAPRAIRTDFSLSLAPGAGRSSTQMPDASSSDRVGGLLRGELPAMRRCFEAEPANARAGAARVSMAFTLGAAGDVRSVTVQTPAPLEHLGPCLREVLRGLRPPPMPGAGDEDYTLALRFEVGPS